MDYAHKMPRILLIAIMLISFNTVAEQVYRSVGPDGSVIFSDKETPGSEAIEVKEVPTVTLPKAPEFRYEEPKKAFPLYQKIEIIRPKNDEAIRENAGDVTITADLDPPLRGGDILEITLDGKIVSTGSSASVSLKSVDRGTHTTQATVKDQTGKVLGSSQPVTFHLLRHSVQHPKPANPAPNAK